jgi:hypothetical protein
MRYRIAGVALTAAVLAGSMVLMSTALATGGDLSCSGNADTSPDGRARFVLTPFGGEGIYPSVSSNGSVNPGVETFFHTQWRNVDDEPRTIRVRGILQEVEPKLQVRVLVNGVDITAKMRADGRGFSFPDVAPGDRTPKVHVRFANLTKARHPFGTQHLVGYYKGSAPPACDQMNVSVNG